jgi:hypothetical protein
LCVYGIMSTKYNMEPIPGNKTEFQGWVSVRLN